MSDSGFDEQRGSKVCSNRAGHLALRWLAFNWRRQDEQTPTNNKKERERAQMRLKTVM